MSKYAKIKIEFEDTFEIDPQWNMQNVLNLIESAFIEPMTSSLGSSLGNIKVTKVEILDNKQ